jgi:CDP-diacylglycerol--glycerol-3-phosphate 3-phosphatidyltransferase
MISLAILDRFPWWIVAVIMVREVGITIFRLAVIRDGVIPASKGGKLKTLTQSFGVGFYILPLPESLHIARDVFMGVAIVLTVWTGIDYIVKWNQSRNKA